MTSKVVRYEVDDDTVVQFEVQPFEGFRPAGPDELVGNLRKAVTPAVEGALAVLEKVKDLGPEQVVVKFGVKASGTMNWMVAKAATEGNFEITLTWKPGSDQGV